MTGSYHSCLQWTKGFVKQSLLKESSIPDQVKSLFEKLCVEEMSHSVKVEDKKAAREAYVRSHNPEDDTLCQLRSMSLGLNRGRMTTNPVVGKLLTFLCKSINAKKVIDIGVFAGCSSFALFQREGR